MMAAPSPCLVPATLLAGGHANGDGGGPPNALVDPGRALFYKRLPVGARAEREAAFYAAVFFPPGAPLAGRGAQATAQGAASEVASDGSWDAAAALARWVPRCLGAPVTLSAGSGGDSDAALYLPLADVTAAYVQPCVADIKVRGQSLFHRCISQLYDICLFLRSLPMCDLARRMLPAAGMLAG